MAVTVNVKSIDATLRQMANEIVEECALIIEEIPSSASIYENVRLAEVVNEFKKRAAFEIRALVKPIT